MVVIYEVVGATVFNTFVRAMPKYQFFITDEPQSQEILIADAKASLIDCNSLESTR